MMVEDDIECDNNDDDALALTVTMALTTSCVVMQEHMDKRKHRQKKKKGRGHPYTLSRQRMSILLIQQLLSNLYFKHSYRFSLNEIEYLIQCIGPHVVVSTNGKTKAPNGLMSLETKLLASICFFAGWSAYNIFPLFGIRHTSLFRCIWAIVHAINETLDMRIDFPQEHFKQQQITHGFMKKLLGLIVVLVALMVCWYGLRNQLNTIAQS